MSQENTGNNIPKFIRRYMPEATEVELQDATKTFRQYVAIVVRIYRRIKSEEEAMQDSPDSGSRDTVSDASHSV